MGRVPRFEAPSFRVVGCRTGNESGRCERGCQHVEFEGDRTNGSFSGDAKQSVLEDALTEEHSPEMRTPRHVIRSHIGVSYDSAERRP